MQNSSKRLNVDEVKFEHASERMLSVDKEAARRNDDIETNVVRDSHGPTRRFSRDGFFSWRASIAHEGGPRGADEEWTPALHFFFLYCPRKRVPCKVLYPLRLLLAYVAQA